MTDHGAGRARNQRGQGTLLREEILAAADRLLASGVDEAAISLRAIAREAGVAAPSIYEHFANKQEILAQLLVRSYTDLVDRIRAAVQDATPDPDGVEPALAAARVFSLHARDEPGRYRLMFEFRQEPIDLAELVTHPVGKVVDALAEAVAATPAARSGRFTARELASTLLSALHGQISLWRTLPMPSDLPTYPNHRERIVLALVGAR